MKVIHFIHSMDRSAGGCAAFVQLLTAEFINSVEIVVVTGNSPNPYGLNGINVYFLKFSLINILSLSKVFSNILIAERPDIIHINGIWTFENWLFQKAAQRLKIKVVLTPHGMLEPYILNRHPFRKKIALALFQDNALRSVDFFHATTQSELNQIIKLGYNQPFAIIANGIDITNIKQKTDWSKSKIKKVLFLSRIHPIKGIEILIDAIAIMKPDGLKITIAGEGEPAYVKSLKLRAVRKGVSHFFCFIGGVYANKKWELLQNSDFFILPTYTENFGIVVVEALATGLPVITTTNTPWQELEMIQCGWWIDLNVQNLVKALNEALNCTPEKIKEMGLRGKQLVEDKYDIKVISQNMKLFYDRILENN